MSGISPHHYTGYIKDVSEFVNKVKRYSGKIFKFKSDLEFLIDEGNQLKGRGEELHRGLNSDSPKKQEYADCLIMLDKAIDLAKQELNKIQEEALERAKRTEYKG